jgi:hypothetical protein
MSWASVGSPRSPARPGGREAQEIERLEAELAERRRQEALRRSSEPQPEPSAPAQVQLDLDEALSLASLSNRVFACETGYRIVD